MSKDFVSSNAHNTNIDYVVGKHYALDELLVLAKQFEAKVTFTSIDDNAFPVLRYRNNRKFVAWYDVENCVGYIA